LLEIEVLTTIIGEFVATVIDEVDRVEYAKDNDKMTAFTILMNSGNRYSLAVKEAA